MSRMTLRTALDAWGLHFGRKVPDGLAESYYQELQHYPDAAMVAVQRILTRTYTYSRIPLLSEILPLMEQQAATRGERDTGYWRIPTYDELHTGYGEYEDRDLLAEAKGLPKLMENLFTTKPDFIDQAAATRILDGAKAYVENLVTGLEQTGQEAKAAEIGKYLKVKAEAPDIEATREALGIHANLLQGATLGSKDLPDRAKPPDEDPPIPF